LSLYFYLVTGFAASFLTRSPAKAMAIFLIFQFAFLMPIFGTGFLTIMEFCTYYTLAYFCVSIIGWMLALVMNVPSVFMNRRSDIDEGCCMVEKCVTGESRMAATRRKLIATGEKGRRMKIGALIYRIVFGSLFIMLFAAATLPYELIPAPLQWLGMLISILCLALIHVIFYFVFRFVPRGGRGVQRMMPLKSVQAVYLSHFREHWVDMTVDVVLYLAIFYVPASLAFCCTSIWAPWWWQFWTYLIICAAYFVFFLIAGLVWLKLDCEPIPKCEVPLRINPCEIAQ
jgi:hypothetical protein